MASSGFLIDLRDTMRCSISRSRITCNGWNVHTLRTIRSFAAANEGSFKSHVLRLNKEPTTTSKADVKSNISQNDNTILKYLTDSSWRSALKDEFSQPYFQKILDFLEEQKREGKIIYPPENEIFNAFNHTPLDKVEVVIIGQDPYHGKGQAQGLSFSVKRGVATPPSLQYSLQVLKIDFLETSTKN